jgi:hypothetical protein
MQSRATPNNPEEFWTDLPTDVLFVTYVTIAGSNSFGITLVPSITSVGRPGVGKMPQTLIDNTLK